MPHKLVRAGRRLGSIASRLGFTVPALAALLLGACEPAGPRVAGTSTTVGTTMGGTALLSDGKPAAGARVTARSEEIIFIDGRPESPILAETVTDASGRYSLRSLTDAGFSLEIDCDPGRGCANAASQQGYFNRIFPDTPTSLPSIAILSPPGSLHGIIPDSAAPSDSALWIGISGTAHFTAALKTPAGDRREFRIDGIFPGKYTLTVLAQVDSAGSSTEWKISPITIKSGAVTEFGSGP